MPLHFKQDFDGSGRPLREVQKQALQWLSDNWDKYRVFAINGPCGSGKSLVARAIQLATGAPIVTASNILLDQYVKEYGMNYVKGRENYESPDGLSCSVSCPIVVGDKACVGCPYKAARARAMAGEPTVFNPASLYFCSHGNIPGDTRIHDEAELLSDFAKMLCSFSFSKSKYEWNENCLSELNLEAWLKDLIRRLEKLGKTYLEAGNRKEYRKIARDLDRIRQTTKAFCDAPEKYVISKEKKRARGRWEEYLNLQPILPPKRFRDAVLGKGKVVLMSGTLFEPDIKELVDDEKFAFLSLESPIPASRRPVLFKPLASKVTYQTPLQEIATSIEKIRTEYPESNMLVHVSYGDSKELSRLLSIPVLSHQKGTKGTVLEQFKKNGGCFLGSGCATGIDLPGQQCEVIYIPRLLKPNLGDPVVKKRKALEGGEKWYEWQVLKVAIQSIGRGCRSKDDFCISIIGDPYFSRLIMKYYKEIPQYFLDAIKWA